MCKFTSCQGHLTVTDAPYYQRTSSAVSSVSLSCRVKSFPAAMTHRELVQQRWTKYEVAHVFPERDGMVNSPQNGLLLQKTVHGLLDQVEISINPNDDYRIVCFLDDSLGVAGLQLDPVCGAPGHPHHVLVRAGEPILTTPGSDMMSAILSVPVPAERMEFELSMRLSDVIPFITKEDRNGDRRMTR
ncbi:hypothetical protein V1517DRAFT_367820 [Lipomyces orientalis]|uniref:Uncharacterized protein n=1 Tax=Lipomyces orientalis TaxID=1233043 RepID=A0ACC3TM47_9ASCO